MLALVQAVLLGGRSVLDASRALPRAKLSYWHTAFRLALDEIAAFAGLAAKPTRPPVLCITDGGNGRDSAEERPTFVLSRVLCLGEES